MGTFFELPADLLKSHCSEIPDPDYPIVPTDDPAQTERDYRAQGFRLRSVYVGKFYQDVCEGRHYACRFYRSRKILQPDLL